MRFGANATYHDFIVGRLKAGSDDGQVSFEAGQDFNGMEYGVYVNDEWAVTDRLKLSYGARVSPGKTSLLFTPTWNRAQPPISPSMTISRSKPPTPA